MGFTRYRLKSLPRKLAYRDGAVSGEPLIITFDITSRREQFAEKLLHEFSLDRDTPADRIMQRLVREGYAETVTGRNSHRWH